MSFLFTPSANSLRRMVIIAATCVLPIAFTGCGAPNSTLTAPSATAGSPPATNPIPPAPPPPSPPSNPTPPPPPPPPGPTVLLYNGKGTSSTDVSAVEAILSTLKLNYATANASQLDALTETELKAYKLFIVPGGNSITIGDNLSDDATTHVRNAVANDGLHYLGVCAGGFFGGYSIYNGLNFTSGVWFNFYADEFKGIHKEAVQISFPSGAPLDIYWQDGPQFLGWGEIVGKFPDGTPAIVEGNYGKGFVILSGVHPEAPASWRSGMNFTTSLAADLTYAGTLVEAALNAKPLPHF